VPVMKHGLFWFCFNNFFFAGRANQRRRTTKRTQTGAQDMLRVLLEGFPLPHCLRRVKLSRLLPTIGRRLKMTGQNLLCFFVAMAWPLILGHTHPRVSALSSYVQLMALLYTYHSPDQGDAMVMRQACRKLISESWFFVCHTTILNVFFFWFLAVNDAYPDGSMDVPNTRVWSDLGGIQLILFGSIRQFRTSLFEHFHRVCAKKMFYPKKRRDL